MHQRPATADVRRASGLPDAAVMHDPSRVARVDALAARAVDSTVLLALVRLAGRAAGAECAQLSLLGATQVATAVRCADSAYAATVSELEDSLCTVTVLSGDVLVAADAHRHPWLHDLRPVVTGAVGAYLGVPLVLADATPVGALCVYEAAPREWSEREVVLTCEVADVVALELQRLDGR